MSVSLAMNISMRVTRCIMLFLLCSVGRHTIYRSFHVNVVSCISLTFHGELYVSVLHCVANWWMSCNQQSLGDDYFDTFSRTGSQMNHIRRWKNKPLLTKIGQISATSKSWLTAPNHHKRRKRPRDNRCIISIITSFKYLNLDCNKYMLTVFIKPTTYILV
jgi:hypothetical protein